MRAYALLLSLSVASCGMITGLSDDYTFVPSGGADGGGGTDGSTNDGGTSTTDGGGSQCQVSGSSLGSTCRACIGTRECCQLAACLNDSACLEYAKCRNDCNRNDEACFKRCEDAANSDTRNALESAVSSCNLTQTCRNTCGFF